MLDFYTTFDTQGNGVVRLKIKSLVLDLIHQMDVVDQLQNAKV